MVIVEGIDINSCGILSIALLHCYCTCARFFIFGNRSCSKQGSLSDWCSGNDLVAKPCDPGSNTALGMLDSHLVTKSDTCVSYSFLQNENHTNATIGANENDVLKLHLSFRNRCKINKFKHTRFLKCGTLCYMNNDVN